jgi:hypothetical protein
LGFRFAPIPTGRNLDLGRIAADSGFAGGHEPRFLLHGLRADGILQRGSNCLAQYSWIPPSRCCSRGRERQCLCGRLRRRA